MKNILFQTTKKIAHILPPAFKRKAIWVMVLLFINSILELIGLASVIPIITLILQENAVKQNQILRNLYFFFGFNSTTVFVVALSVVVLVVIISKNIISLRIIKIQTSFSYKLYKYISIKLFKYYYNKGFSFFKETNANILLRQINGVPLDFSNQIVINTITLLNESVILFLIVASLLFYDPLIVLLLFFTIVPVFFVFYKGVKNKIHSIQVRLNSIAPELSKSLFQAIYGYVDVKISNTEKAFFGQHEKLLEKTVSLRTKDKVYQQAPTKVIETAVMASIILVALYGMFFLEDRNHLVGLISVFALAAYRILPSINRMMIAIIGIRGFQYVLDIVDLTKFEDNQKNYYNPANSTLKFNFAKSLDLEGVSFSYSQGTHVLNEINLQIKKGDKVGIIGRSGSGKSTLVNIILGFLHPSKGKIEVDNKTLSEENLIEWRNLIGYVQQDVYVLDATLAKNIAFGLNEDEIDYKRIDRVIKLSKLEDLVKSLPNGYKTKIGERGTMISGGQRQRLGIARALYKEVQIIVLDEATSALDSETEEELTDSIDSLSETDLTVIVIAHRLTTLRKCNHIFELSEGVLQRDWSYKELMNERIIIN